MQGWIHSVESFGTVDGPGIRMVIFMQGCPMRCAYCHNPDTWPEKQGTLMSTEELLERFEKNRGYYRSGGITVSGGEPLCQSDFVTELFRQAKQLGISTCLDTSGIMFPYRKTAEGWSVAQEGIHDTIGRKGTGTLLKAYEELLSVTDLVLLDLKHMDPQKHRELTGHSNGAVFAFLEYLEECKVPVWIRRVIVPGYTDDDKELLRLGEYIGGFSNLQAVEVLPYHTLGLSKYKELGLPYRLTGVPEEKKETATEKRNVILQGIRNRRRRKGSGEM